MVVNGELKPDAGETNLLTLTGEWKFITDDNVKYKEVTFDDSPWNTIKVPSEWGRVGIKYDGTAWYRAHFTLTPDLANKNLGIQLPLTSNAHELFINGISIGSKGDISENGKLIKVNFRKSVYLIPMTILNQKSDNVISIRIASFYYNGGILFNDIHLGTYDEIHSFELHDLLKSAAIVAICFFTAIYHLFLFIARRRDKYYFYFAGMAFMTGFIIAGRNTLGYFVSDNQDFNAYFIYFPIISLHYWIIHFLSSFFGYSYNKLKKVSLYSTFVFMLALITGSLHHPFFPYFNSVFLTIALLMLVIYFVIGLGVSIKAFLEKKTGSGLLLTGIGIWGVHATSDILYYLKIIVWKTPEDVGFAYLIGALALAVSRKFSLLHIQSDRLNEQLQEQNSRLLEMDKLKDTFVANTSHELRTPLHGILGLTEFLLQESAGDINKEQRKNLELIISSAERLKNLVNDILDFEKSKSKELELQLQPLDLFDVTTYICNLFSRNVLANEVVIINKIKKDQFGVFADEDRLIQVFNNMIGNAVKFTEKGAITLGAHISKEDPSFLEIFVQDTGTGISPEYKDQIFQEFEQVPGIYKGGTGLGLSITKKIVESHKGKIRIESELNIGSTFYFTLPIAQLKSITAKKNSLKDKLFQPEKILETVTTRTNRTPIVTPQQATIFAVDDDPVNLQILVNFLSSENHNVKIFSNGNGVLEALEKETPDLLILDVMMPGISGYETTEIIRKNHNLLELPILILSAKSRLEDMVDGLTKGANDFLSKPVSQAELMARVNTLLLLKTTGVAKNRLESIEHNLKKAYEIQMQQIPQSPPIVKDLEIISAYIPAEVVSGDLFDFYEDASGVGIIITDVSGHGLAAAMVSGLIKMSFLLNHIHGKNPGSLMSAMNNQLTNRMFTHFFTAIYLYIDLNEKVIRIARGGHPHLICQNLKTAEVTFAGKSGSPLGCLANVDYQEEQIPLQQNFRYLLLTDGVIEAFQNSIDDYALDNFLLFIKENISLTLEELKEKIVKKVYGSAIFNSRYSDDVTFVAFDSNRLTGS
ncbi:MAG: SpoIIE family protein phosphatase [Spirochaetia bacterium]|nr:SpoIIE family protein phosphatase [Spirochaetia bacterium]